MHCHRNPEQITQGVYYISQNGAAYIGQGGIRANGATYAARIVESSVERFGTESVAENAIRFAVSNGTIQASREVAEQRLINSVGGIGSSNLLNAVNPIGQARQGLLAAPAFGEITGIAVPNLLGISGAAATGGTIGAATSLSAK